MRQHKYRAWDKPNGCWFEPTYKAYESELEELLINLNGRLSLRTMSGIADESTFPDRFEVSEYTGLTDKNGVETAEGDWLQWTFCDYHSQPELDEITEIKWIDAGFNIEPMSCDTYEVIGNIWENKELLDDSK